VALGSELGWRGLGSKRWRTPSRWGGAAQIIRLPRQHNPSSVVTHYLGGCCCIVIDYPIELAASWLTSDQIGRPFPMGMLRLYAMADTAKTVQQL